MVLDDLARGLLEREIDLAINDIPELMAQYRLPEMKSKLLYKDESDFVLGLTFGRILSMYGINFRIKYNRILMNEEITEMHQILTKRTIEIREAMFTSG
jgi:hypothetical protein